MTQPDKSNFRTILADPPWPLRWSGGSGGRRRRAVPLAYELMSIEEITALPVGEWAAPDAHLYLWVTPELHYLGRCWDIADKNIARFKASLDKALRGEGTANPAICREMIDKWLEYRHAHGPNDEAQL